MSILADSSTVFKALATRSTRRLAGHHTLELARYEVGNAIVKECRIFKTLKPEVAEELTREVANLIANMVVLSIEGAEDAVTRIAIQSALSFYDAAYMHTAATLGLTLATEDKRLARAAKDADVQTTSLSELG